MNSESRTSIHLPALLCPQCRAPVEINSENTVCRFGHAFPMENGIPDLRPEEEQERFAPFLAQYYCVRREEQWGDGSAAYYTSLPFRDVTGKHAFEWGVKSRSYRTLLGLLRAQRAKTVLDLGAGNCWLSHRLWKEGFHGAAVDINNDDLDGLAATRRYWPDAQHHWRIARASFEHIPFAERGFDAVIFNSSFHYHPRPHELIQKTMPLLTSNGRLYIVDSPMYRNASSGAKMMQERAELFSQKFDIVITDDTQSYFLTYDDIDRLAGKGSIRARIHTPWYGVRWFLRPIIAGIRGKREPASFGIIELWKD